MVIEPFAPDKRKKGGGREASPFFDSHVRLGAVHRSAAPWPPTG